MRLSDGGVVPFQIAIPQAAVDDLDRRLTATRWPDAETVDDWSQGVPLTFVRQLLDYWRTEYDWRRCERTLNALGSSRARIDGIDIHFLHIRSRVPGATPMIMTHGWPGSIIEFHKVIAPLTDPVAHGEQAADAFHLVIPSLPGYGFSAKPTSPGWGVNRIARAWIKLMELLDYDRFVAQGGDWGAMVTTTMGSIAPPELIGVHVNMPLGFPLAPYPDTDLTEFERSAIASRRTHDQSGRGYSVLQATRPQTLGYGLLDSPAGQAAWILEKFQSWSGGGDLFSLFTMDELLDNISLYWYTASAASAARLYWESSTTLRGDDIHVTVPAALSIFPQEISRPSRRWAESVYKDIRYWNMAESGGHFAAMEQPDVFVREVRAGIAAVRR